MNLLLAFFQDSPPIISQPQGTDWVQLATTIGGFVVTIVGMILTYLKANQGTKLAKETHMLVHGETYLRAGILKSLEAKPPEAPKPINPSSVPSNP